MTIHDDYLRRRDSSKEYAITHWNQFQVKNILKMPHFNRFMGLHGIRSRIPKDPNFWRAIGGFSDYSSSVCVIWNDVYYVWLVSTYVVHCAVFVELESHHHHKTEHSLRPPAVTYSTLTFISKLLIKSKNGWRRDTKQETKTGKCTYWHLSIIIHSGNVFFLLTMTGTSLVWWLLWYGSLWPRQLLTASKGHGWLLDCRGSYWCGNSHE